MKIKVNDSVIMPEPDYKYDDMWQHGGFCANVVDIHDNGNLIVEDADGDFFEVEGYRVTLAE